MRPVDGNGVLDLPGDLAFNEQFHGFGILHALFHRATIDPEEGNIHLVGRGKGVIIQRGSNVYPREIKDRLHARPVVQEVAVVCVGDELLGEAICTLGSL